MWAGTDVTIGRRVDLVAETLGYAGRIVWDTSKPDGTPRKLLDTTLLSSPGRMPRIFLEEGLPHTYQSFLAELQSGRLRT